MDIEVKITIDKDIYDIFQIVLKRHNHNEKEIIENYLISYLSHQMAKDQNRDLMLSKKVAYSEDYQGKANDKIPVWAHKPSQYNHKIIKAYFKLLNQSNEVTLYNMELLCSDKSTPELYVPTFRTNYASMKYDGEKSHGRVFEDDGKYVKIWSGVEKTLLKYKSFFE